VETESKKHFFAFGFKNAACFLHRKGRRNLSVIYDEVQLDSLSLKGFLLIAQRLLT